MRGLVKLLAFACSVMTAAAVCSMSKYNQGTRDWLICSNSNLNETKARLQANLIAVSVSQSVIPEIPDRTFIINATTVEILNLHDCGISHIGSEAFRGLTSLKKLSLSYNNLTQLNGAWFYDLKFLEQLDVSFNAISDIDSSIFFQLPKLQSFELNDNRLNCIPTTNMENLRALKNMHIQENPLSYTCRAKLTLWLKNHNVNYAIQEDTFFWSDHILWLCLADLKDKNNAKEMNMCVMTRMFTQLTSILAASPSLVNSTAECFPFRQSLTECLKGQGLATNGEILINVLELTRKAANIGAP